MANCDQSIQKFGTPSPSPKLGMQQNTRIGTPPASSFLNAFERSFESFLNNTVEKPSSIPNSSSLDHGSAAGISAILNDSSLENQKIQNPLLTHQTQSNITKKNSQEAIVRNRKVQGPKPKLLSKTLTLSKTKTYNSNQITVEEKIKEAQRPTLVSYQDDESTEAVNNLLKAEGGVLSPERDPKTPKSRGHLQASSDTSLNTNTSVFRGQKVYKCDQCERSYASKQYFQVHKCTKGSEPDTRQSKVLVNEANHVKSARGKVKKDDDQKYLENVHIDVPVTILSSEIVFRGNDNFAYIEGDIIDLDVEEITLEEAIIDGYQVETLSEHSNTVTIEGNIAKQVPNSSLPCALELISLSSGIDIDEIKKIIEVHSDDESVVPRKFPWQADLKEETSKLKLENQLLPRRNESGGKLSNTLEELPSVNRSKSTEKPSNLNVSLNKFTYFNDTSIAYGSGDDSDDEDWSEMSEKAKRKAPLKFQSKKPTRNQPFLSLSEKRRSIGQETSARRATNSSLLLQEEDAEEESLESNDRKRSSLLLFSTLN